MLLASIVKYYCNAFWCASFINHYTLLKISTVVLLLCKSVFNFFDDLFLAVSFILPFFQSFHYSYVKFHDLFLFFCSAPPSLWVLSDFYFQRYIEISATILWISHLVAVFLLINIRTSFILDCRFSDLWHWVKWVKGWRMLKIGNVLRAR